MTAQEHNKIVSILFLVLGGVGILSLFMTALQFGLGNGLRDIEKLGQMIRRTNPDFPIDIYTWFVALLIFSAILGLLTSLLELAAGFGLLKQKSWGRVIGIVAACLALLGIPLGTAFGIYALWFLLGDKGKQLYRGSAP